jgi:hypothetical protein
MQCSPLAAIGRVHGPVQARVRWEPDNEPYDWGDIGPTSEDYDYLEMHPPEGCIVEIRRPALLHPDAPAPQWEHAASLWSIVGDDAYHREVERELIAEVER